MANLRIIRTLAIFLTLAVAFATVSILPSIPPLAAEQHTTRYVIEVKLPTGDVLPLSEITVFREDSWSFSVKGALVSGTFYFGDLPPRPDQNKDKVVAIEVSSDEGATGFRAVLERFPAGGTLLIRQDGNLFTEATVTYNPEAV